MHRSASHQLNMIGRTAAAQTMGSWRAQVLFKGVSETALGLQPGAGSRKEDYRLISTPCQLQGDVDPQTGVELVVVSLQGYASGGCVTDDGHQLFAALEGLLLLYVDLSQPHLFNLICSDMTATAS